jgi:hypothetical protein
MAAGIPGVGIGGIFYLASALLMPVRELWLVARNVRGAGSAEHWRVIARQWSIAAGILTAIWATGWALGKVLTSRIAVGDAAAGAAAAAAAHGVSLRIGALILSFGTLAVVLALVQVARLVRRATHRVKPVARLADARADEEEESDAPPARLPLTLLLVGCFSLAAARIAHAQDARALRSSAEQAYENGDRAAADSAYSGLLAVAPDDSRALYRLGGLRGADPVEASRLYARYVALEPTDAWGWLSYADAARETRPIRRGRSRPRARGTNRSARARRAVGASAAAGAMVAHGRVDRCVRTSGGRDASRCRSASGAGGAAMARGARA